MSVYEYSAMTIKGEEVPLEQYKGNVLLIVNTATNCGFAPQFDGLQELYEFYKDKGLTVLGFPSNQFMNQEPRSESEIDQHCKLNYGVDFPMFSKVDVKGPNIHPLFQYLTENAPGVLTKQVKWNFTKFLVDASGHVVNRYAPQTKPEQMKEDIEKLLSHT
ncbi:glutathione peroxidase [Radiobacillus kanasensis]|uniref:glutathione peroxidase n=1 Tax=Radiobacillus kanasensis TaxID=2844358 RepID=UPI001E3B29EC|nr:glutathione peroxidase [Radiobacillus kanasensis]UFT99772.1 glutathione peroxidase [Radiobacillus kanasensis]